MDEVLSVFVIGLSRGSIFFLLATGLSLTMGLMRIVNMAHGALYMMGAFLGLYVAKQTGNFWVGCLAAAACAAALGLLIETGFLRRLYKQEADQVLLTIGFIYVLIGAATWIWGTLPQSGVSPSIFSASVQVGSVTLSVWRFFLIAFGLVMALLLWLFQDKTKVGAKVRAGMDSKEVASALGVNLRVLFTGVFVLGSAVAGLSGLLGSQTYSIESGLAWTTLLTSLIVVVVGGAGSIQGALIGGVFLGLLEAFGEKYSPKAAAYLIYAALVVILLFRPSGLLGSRIGGGQHGSDALERASAHKPKTPRRATSKATSLGASVAVRPAWQLLLKKYLPYAVVLAVLVAVPFSVGSFQQTLMTKVLLFAVFAMSLDLLMGYTGLISFGHAAFFGMGGYAIAILTKNYDITSFWIVFPLAILLSAALASFIGFLSLRVSGVYFLLVTMAFGQLLFVVAEKWNSLTRGKSGLPGIRKPDLWFGSHQWTNLSFYFLVLVVFLLCFFLMYRITHSGFGRTLVGIRDNESRMKSLGFNTWGAKYAVIMLAAVFAGAAGALWAYQNNTMVPTDFALERSALPMLMVIIGGGGSLWGPCLGAAVIVLAEYYSSLYLGARWYLIMGGLFVFSVMFLKGGLARYLSRIWDKVWSPRAKKVGLDQLSDGGGRP
jgi:branched-chain amino acid transport system permease protein